MDLYFLRHGMSGQHGDPAYTDDSLRPLTAEGRKKLKLAALGMKAMNIKYDAVLSSPYLRALQTAEIVAQAYNIKKIHLTQNLLPPARVPALLKEINNKFPDSPQVLLVGHEPHLSGLISSLLVGNTSMNIDFKKGGLCLVRLEEGAALQWLLTPTQLGLLANKTR